MEKKRKKKKSNKGKDKKEKKKKKMKIRNANSSEITKRKFEDSSSSVISDKTKPFPVRSASRSVVLADEDDKPISALAEHTGSELPVDAELDELYQKQKRSRRTVIDDDDE